MSKLFSEQATVRIWRNVKTGGNLPTSHFGHAAVSIDGRTLARKDYISFWPAKSAGINPSAVLRQKGKFTANYAEDKVNEMNDATAVQLEVAWLRQHGLSDQPGYREDYAEWLGLLNGANKKPLETPREGQKRRFLYPNDPLDQRVETYTLKFENGDQVVLPLWAQSAENKISLPGLGAEGRFWGLSLDHMADWYEKFRASQPRYRALAFQNCAGVALMALKAGGSEVFLPCPGVKIYAEPAQVEEYAGRLRGVLEVWDLWANSLLQDAGKAMADRRFGPNIGQETAGSLWSVETWKRESALGGLTVRSGTIRDIDSALKEFHQYQWDTNFPARFAALAKVFQAVLKHRNEKAESKRTEAVVRLGVQVLDVLRKPGAWKYYR